MQDIRPRLPPPDSWTEEAGFSSPTISECSYYNFTDFACLNDWTTHLQPHPGVLEVYYDLIKFSRATACDISDRLIDHRNLKLPAWTNVAMHKLLSLRPLESVIDGVVTVADLLAEAFRLAMLLYLAPIWRYYGVHPTYNQTAPQKLHQLMSTRLNRGDWGDKLQNLRLWVLGMGSIESGVMGYEKARQYFVNAAAEGAVTSESWIADIKHILWVPGLFDEQLAALRQNMESL